MRSLQRQLEPDNVGPETIKPTFLQALSIKAGTAKTHRFQNIYGSLNEPLLFEAWRRLNKKGAPGTVIHPHSGTPQGGMISPILATIYLHYGVDLWFERSIKSQCRGQAHIIRFADDFVCAFQYKGEAERFYRTLPKRLAKFGLAVAPEKTCIHRFSRFHPSRARRFTFLGFEFYWESDTKGIPRVWRRTSRKKLQAGIKACREWVKANRYKPLRELIPTMIRKVRGHYNYFRAVGNMRSLWTFYWEAVGSLYKWLNRRSQRRSLTWEGMKRVLAAYAFPARAKRGNRNCVGQKARPLTLLQM